MISVSNLSEIIDCSIEGNNKVLIEGVGDLRSAPKNFISFLSDKRYYKFFKDSASSIVIVKNDFSEDRLDKTLIRVENPVFSYIKICQIVTINYTSGKKLLRTIITQLKRK